MITSTELLRSLSRRVPESVEATGVTFQPYAHTATTVTMRARIPRAGTAMGVHFPAAWPRHTGVLTVRWVTGENVLVGNTAAALGSCPARALRMLKFWAKAGEVLEITLYLKPGGDVSTTAMASRRDARPVTLLVHPAQNGLAKAVRWLQGGLAKLGRAATV
jgi:hypothetical protein